MSAKPGRAIPGEQVGAFTCGKRLDSGGYCGRPIEYRIRFAGWRPEECAGACAEHAAEAREMDVERIWSVTP